MKLIAKIVSIHGGVSWMRIIKSNHVMNQMMNNNNVVTGNCGMNRLTLNEGKKKLVSLLKVISPIVMVGAIGLELWNLEAKLTTNQFPNSLMPVLWLGHLAIATHLIEAVVAALKAPTKKHQPIQYGIYTFFVGTVGLWELFESDTTSELKSKS